LPANKMMALLNFYKMKDTKEKLVSCIIPTHNRSSLLKRVVDSVINQTHENLEIIIVNDGSSDDTEEVINQLKGKDPRIVSLVNEKPQGPSAARNKGIKIATGDFVAFLDDDDQWLPNRIADNLLFLKKYDVSLCAPTRGYSNLLFRKCREELIKIKDFKKGTFLPTSFLMGHSYVFKEIQFDEDLYVGEDWDLYIRIANKFKIAFFNRALVIFNAGEHKKITNETINMSIDQLEKRMGAVYKHKTFLGPHWFNYRVAGTLLCYIRYRENKILRVFLQRIATHAKKHSLPFFLPINSRFRR